MLDESTLNDYVINNQTTLLEEINYIRLYLSLIENKIKSSHRSELLSDNQVKTISQKLQTAGNFVYGANYFWAKYTNDEELVKQLANGVAMELEKGKKNRR